MSGKTAYPISEMVFQIWLIYLKDTRIFTKPQDDGRDERPVLALLINWRH